jgi:hypothetical protein
MKVGWAYLGLAALLVILGVILSLSRGGYIGDIILVISIGFIYIGSNALADENEAAKLTERAK